MILPPQPTSLPSTSTWKYNPATGQLGCDPVTLDRPYAGYQSNRGIYAGHGNVSKLDVAQESDPGLSIGGYVGIGLAWILGPALLLVGILLLRHCTERR